MRSKMRPRLSFANVVSLIALFVALGGSAYAIQLKKNAVKSKHIKDGQVLSADVADGGLGGRDLDGSLTGANVDNGSLGTADVDGSLTGADIADGSLAGADVGGSLTGTNVADGSLGTADIDDSLTGANIADGSVGGAEITNETVQTEDIADNEVGTNDVTNESLIEFDLATNSVGLAELAANSVRAAELGDAIVNHGGAPVGIDGGTGQNGSYNTGLAQASCSAGEELISGSGSWDAENADPEIFIQEITLNHSSETVSVIGGNDDGVGHDLTAVATCLQL